MPSSMAEVDVYVPDGLAVELALERATVLAVGAHPDDLELIGLAHIGQCRDRGDRWFAGVVCATGAPPDSPAMAEIRRAEQCRAAEVGNYAAVIQFGLASAAVRAVGNAFVDRLGRVLIDTGADVVVTHAPTDKHPTHVGVVRAVVDAVRSLPPDRRPAQLIGVEAWRDLDWLPDERKVRMDCTGLASLAAQLLACYSSQLGDKRYERAAAGRRIANATFFDPSSPDVEQEVVVGMDLTALVDDDSRTLRDFTLAEVDRFRADVERGFDGPA